MADPCSLAILQKYMAKNIADPGFKRVQSLSLKTLYKLSESVAPYPEGQLEAIQKELEEQCGGGPSATQTPPATTAAP